MKVVNMEHKISKREQSIHHGIKEKTELSKRAESGISSAARTLGKPPDRFAKPGNPHHRVVFMNSASTEHKISKREQSIHHGIKEKTELSKRAESGISSAARTLGKPPDRFAKPLKSAKAGALKPIKMSAKMRVKIPRLNHFYAQKTALKKTKFKGLNKAVDKSRLKKLKLAEFGKYREKFASSRMKINPRKIEKGGAFAAFSAKASPVKQSRSENKYANAGAAGAPIFEAEKSAAKTAAAASATFEKSASNPKSSSYNSANSAAQFAQSKRAQRKVRLNKIKKFKKGDAFAEKVKSGAQAVNKFAVAPIVGAAKKTASAAGTAFDKSASADPESSYSYTARFAQKSYTVGKTTAKTGVNAVKKTLNAPRKLAKGVHRGVQQVKRTVRDVKRAAQAARRTAKAAAKAAKVTAKFTAKIVKAIVKAAVQVVKAVVSLIVETSPWSLIIIAVILLVALIVFFVSNLITQIAGGSAAVTWWAVDESAAEEDVEQDVYNNISEVKALFLEAYNDGFADEMKNDLTDFCVSSSPQRIVLWNGIERYPAYNASAETRGWESFSRIAEEEYADFIATLVVLKSRSISTDSSDGTEEALEDLEKFKKSDFAEFIGAVNDNSCEYGSTFFVKTTEKLSDQTCPNESCEKEYLDDDCASREDEDGNIEYYCKGHRYCPGEHEKMVVVFRTAADYYDKSIAEIYGFDEDEQSLFEAVKEFISATFADSDEDSE